MIINQAVKKKRVKKCSDKSGAWAYAGFPTSRIWC